jgi:hypothetical protein
MSSFAVSYQNTLPIISYVSTSIEAREKPKVMTVEELAKERTEDFAENRMEELAREGASRDLMFQYTAFNLVTNAS